jgi:hypothetical protein
MAQLNAYLVDNPIDVEYHVALPSVDGAEIQDGLPVGMSEGGISSYTPSSRSAPSSSCVPVTQHSASGAAITSAWLRGSLVLVSACY